MPDAAKLAHLRRLHATGPVTEAERAELDHADNVYGDRWWMTALNRKWFELAEAVAEFHEIHGRWPSVSGTDPDELRVGRWLSQQRVAANAGNDRLTVLRREFLDEVAAGWNPDREQQWRDTAGSVGEFFTSHGRWPSSVGKTGDERRLGQWLNQERVRANTNHPLLTADRRRHLDAVAPGWRDGRTATWQRTLDAVSAFRSTHGRWPSAAAPDLSERRLGKWINDQRKDDRNAAARFTADRRQQLAAVAPGWRIRA